MIILFHNHTPPNGYKFNFQITREHPYVIPLESVSFTPEEAFMALVYAMAENPGIIFNMDESGVIYKSKKQYGQVYWIRQQE